MNWFKFYGQDFLTDPKMMGLSVVHRALWITILCLASQNNGVIKHIDQYKIMVLSGISPLDDEWQENEGFLDIFVTLGLVTYSNEEITVLNYDKRQSSNLSNAERQQRFRDKQKESEAKTPSNVTQSYDSNAREEKNRIDKKRIERDEEHIAYLTKIPQEHLKEFNNKFNCTEKQVIAKGEALFNYCKAKGKLYKNYQSFLRNALEKDYGLRTTPIVNSIDYIAQKEAELRAEKLPVIDIHKLDVYQKIGKPF